MYLEGDEVSHIYFLTKGKGGFVLPSFENTKYINIRVGDHFGVIDIVGSITHNSLDFEDWMNRKDVIKRQFTIMSEVDKTEVLTLSINDLHRMKLEFYEQYETLFDDATIKLRRTWISKLRAMKSC